MQDNEGHLISNPGDSWPDFNLKICKSVSYGITGSPSLWFLIPACVSMVVGVRREQGGRGGVQEVGREQQGRGGHDLLWSHEPDVQGVSSDPNSHRFCVQTLKKHDPHQRSLTEGWFTLDRFWLTCFCLVFMFPGDTSETPHPVLPSKSLCFWTLPWFLKQKFWQRRGSAVSHCVSLQDEATSRVSPDGKCTVSHHLSPAMNQQQQSDRSDWLLTIKEDFAPCWLDTLLLLKRFLVKFLDWFHFVFMLKLKATTKTSLMWKYHIIILFKPTCFSHRSSREQNPWRRGGSESSAKFTVCRRKTGRCKVF